MNISIHMCVKNRCYHVTYITFDFGVRIHVVEREGKGEYESSENSETSDRMK